MTEATSHRTEHRRYYTFINLALTLGVITGIEIVIISLPFPKWVSTTGLVVLSTTKFGAVIFWFMHLLYDKKLLTLLFLAGMAIALGTAAALVFLANPAHVAPNVG